MSTIKLPPLPHYLRKTLDSYQEGHVTAYAEEAVRQALAAQVPVAWLYHDAKPGTVPAPDDISTSMAISLTRRPEWRNEMPLALIPEKDHGEST